MRAESVAHHRSASISRFVVIATLMAIAAGCGASKHHTATRRSSGDSGSSGICGSSSAPASCIELTQDDLGQTYLAYPNLVEAAYRNGRRVDVYTTLSDTQTATAVNVCDQAFIDSVPDGVGIDISDPLIVVWSADDTILATGA